MTYDLRGDTVNRTVEGIKSVGEAIDVLLDDNEAAQIPPSAVNDLVASAVRLHAATKEAHPELALNAAGVSPTEALTLVGDLLAAHNIRAFDLALWLSHVE